jgi:Domain of unknown function (DUF4037)
MPDTVRGTRQCALPSPTFSQLEPHLLAGLVPAYVTRVELEAACAAVTAGEGRRGYPIPVIAVHGLVHGKILFDREGSVTGLQRTMAPVPATFKQKASTEALASIDSYLHDLDGCVGRSDGLLFHAMASQALREVFIAWFAVNDIYWPHEKRLGERLRLAGRDDVAELESRVWTAGDLSGCLLAIRDLLSLVLPEVEGQI